MSYILDAIRKSEAERTRKSKQKPLRRRHPPQRIQRPWVGWLFGALVALVAINIATLGYLANRDSASAPAPREAEDTQAPSLGVDSGEVSGSESVNKQALSKPMVSKHPPPQTAEEDGAKPSLGSNSSTYPRRQDRASLRFPSPSSPGLATAEKGQPSPAAPSKIGDGLPIEPPPLPKSLDQPDKGLPKVLMPLRAPAEISDNPRKAPVSEEIPLFSELPSEMRQRIPPIKVNVYAYSSVPREQFVIVGMVKYRPGDEIGSGLMLEEVTREGIVLRFEGQPFRLTRP